MKKTIFSIFVLALMLTNLQGQQMADCTKTYLARYRYIAEQQKLKKINNHVGDSLVNVCARELGECLVGSEIPDIRLVSSTGKIYTRDSLKGKVVMLNFWYLGCAPCIGELPMLNRLNEHYKNRKDFILLSILREDSVQLNKFLDRTSLDWRTRQISFEIVPNSNALMKAEFPFLNWYPTHMFIDRDGKIYREMVGGISEAEQEPHLEAKIKGIIEEKLGSAITSDKGR